MFRCPRAALAPPARGAYGTGSDRAAAAEAAGLGRGHVTLGKPKIVDHQVAALGLEPCGSDVVGEAKHPPADHGEERFAGV